jgi:PAS domain S-box-containing protein
MQRNGYPEETYYTLSYTPRPGDDGNTAGMICANTDDTERIISERQLKTLIELGHNLTDCKTDSDVIERSIQTIAQNHYDFPFAIFRTVYNNKAILAHSTDLGMSADLVKNEIDLTEDAEIPFLLKQAALSQKKQVFEGLRKKVGAMPGGAWEISPDKVIILPITQMGGAEAYCILMVGMNPYRLLDEAYSSFFSLVADQIANSFANVHALDAERKRSEGLAEIDKAKTTFFSNISHEFRTPLTLLLGPMEEMLNDPTIDAAHKIRADVAYRNALRMQKLVNTLLEFSRVEGGWTGGKFKRVNIVAITRDLASSFRSAIEKSGMQLIFQASEIQKEVYVDLDMWEKIVLNLISNAFKYSSQGTITLSLDESNNNVTLSVSDTGIGIPEDQLDKIFNRFHRVDNREGRSQEGTGIGLALVKEMVKFHQGTITVSSELGKGSTFVVTIPAGKGHLPVEKISTTNEPFTLSSNVRSFTAEASKWETANSEPDENNGQEQHQVSHWPTVLLADDNTDMRQYVEHLLSSKFNVINALNGEEAYEKALSQLPDLILSDIMMPKLDGFGLLKKIRNHPSTKNIPVILLSARAGEESKVEGLDAGADDYLVKPFSARELIARVDANIKIAKTRIVAEENLRKIIMQAPVAMAIMKGKSLVIEIANEKALEHWGKKYDEVINKPALEAFPEIIEQGFEKILSGVLTTGIPFIANEMPVKLIRHGQPEIIYINFIYQPLVNSDGLIEGIVTVGIDVTEQVTARKKINEHTEILEEEVRKRTHQLNEVNRSLQNSNEDLQQFAHVASHDLKEPVRKIKTFAGRLSKEYADEMPDKARIFLKKIEGATDRMFKMIEGVLSYSTIDAGGDAFAPVDMNKLIDNIEEDIEILLEQKQALIKRSGLPVIEGIPVLLYQLFYNLITNSLKFAKPGEAPVIEITGQTIRSGNRDYLNILFRDNGIGFDQEHAERIFNTFTRLHSKDEFEGTGLGLALCRKIVERHGGTISATGIRDGGAVFNILIPAKKYLATE